MTTNKVWSRLLQSTALVGVAALATPAHAQDEPDTIIVTGTLIKRQDIAAPSPVTSVSAEELAVVNTVNTEDFLNTLPQAIPGFDATSNNPGDGVATANLRGLGAVRTLVLVEGRRMVPYDSQGIVDLNQIPAALVARTDVVTGGASALYGSDAVAGVINFDLRDEFEGFEINSSYEVSEEGDGDIFQASVITGGDFADGRGNATFFAAYTDRQPVFQGDREFSTIANDDADVGDPFTPFGSSGVPGTRFFDTYVNPNAAPVFDGAAVDADGDFAGGSCSGEGVGVVDPDGSLSFRDVDLDGEFGAGDTAGFVSGDEVCGGGFTFNQAGNPIPWINSGANTTRYNYAPVNYLQLPQERYNLAAFATYDIADHTELKLRGMFANNVVAQELAPTPLFESFDFNIGDDSVFSDEAIAAFTSAINLNVAGQQAAITRAQQDLAFAQGLTAAEIDARNADDNEDNDIDLDALAAAPTDLQDGLDDFLASVDTDGDGNFDTYRAYIGRRMLETDQRNSTRDQAAVQWVAETNTDLGNGMFWTNYAQYSRTFGSLAQTGNVSRSAFQDALDNGCNPLGEGAITPDCAAQFQRTGIIQNEFEQTVAGTQLSGDFFGLTLPTASNSIGFAAGVEYREERTRFQPDSVLGPDVAGFNQSAPIRGSFDVIEGFAEFAVPLIEGRQFFDELSFNGALRFSDYSTVGTLTTYQAGGAWAPAPGYTFKASYNRAARAPNLNELFAPVVNGFPQADDPCAIQSADGEATGSRSICTAEGVPSGAYGTTALQPNSQIESLFGGNENLEEEVADTFTAGVVLQPDWLDGLTLTVDYYDIQIEDVISTVPVQEVLDGCYVDGTQSLCDLVDRSGSGTIQFITLNNQNLAELKYRGIDFDADYQFDPAVFGFDNVGTFSTRFVGTYRIEESFTAFDGQPAVDCAGTYRGRFGGCFIDQPKPEWKHTMFLTHNIGELSTTLRWRYIGEVTADDSVDPSGNNDDFRDLRATTIDAYNYFDLSSNYQLTENLRFAAGINNLLDNDAPILSDSFAEQANTWPATYDPFGRSFFVSATLSF
jgi:outer membrane receptor protein involved in Fe transport